MSVRIPPSLSWLIDKRARLDGEIRRTRASLAKARHLIEELSTLEEDLAAIDRTLELHEIKVDVRDIAPINTQYVRVKLPHGSLTQSILLFLRLREGVPARMSEIVSFIEARYADIDALAESRGKLSRSVHYRLKSLARQGVLKRHHFAHENSEGIWSLME